MRKELLQKEASACRKMAKEFAGRPEEAFLLKVASTMEELAVVESSPC
jgi:hypothetical protein